MSAKVTLEGSGAGAIRIVDQVKKALDGVQQSADKAAAGAKRLEESLQKDAARIKELIDPQVKLNRLYEELGKHVTAGRLSMDEATAAGVKYRRELIGVAEVGEKAFGRSMLSNLAATAAGYLSVSSAISAVLAVMRKVEETKERAAQQDSLARAGLGSLSQLAGGEGTRAARQAKFDALVAEARGFVGAGAAADENEAGALLFRLAGAGLNEQDRAFAAQIKAAGTLTDVGGAAEAFSALRVALGQKEVGTFREFLSKSLRAAGPAPGSFEQLPIAAAASGGSAKALGISDEFLLAATTVLGQTRGSISEGGTLLEALLKQVEKSGLKGVQGVGGVGIIERLAALPERQQGFGGVLGDRAEAVQALRILRDNLPAVRDLEAGVIAARGADLAGEAAGLPETDPQLAAAIGESRARGGLAVERGRMLGRARNVLKAVRQERLRILESQGEEFAAGVAETMAEVLPNRLAAESEIRGAYRNLQDYSPETQKLITDYLRDISESNKRIEQGDRSRATTRNE